MNEYYIPANTKRGQLIFNMFKPIDLAIAIIGVVSTIVLLVIVNQFKDPSWIFSVLATIPGLTAVALVFPIPNYHNVRVLLGEIKDFYNNPRNYKWRGWCSLYESTKGKTAVRR